MAVVTGGASGIGLAISRRLATEGHAVAVVDLDGGAADQAARTIEDGGGKATALAADVADREAVFVAIDEARSRLGPIGVLVNNAGMGSGMSRFLKLTPEQWDQIFRVNVTGAFNCCQAVLPDMLEAGWGRIVNISSSSTHAGQAWMSQYVSSKSALNGLTKCLALEFGPKGITVNAIPPGFIDTPMMQTSVARGDFGPEGLDGAIARTPVRRVGLPEDVAALCAFLCRDEASYITGQILGVNGGRNT